MSTLSENIVMMRWCVWVGGCTDSFFSSLSNYMTETQQNKMYFLVFYFITISQVCLVENTHCIHSYKCYTIELQVIRNKPYIHLCNLSSNMQPLIHTECFQQCLKFPLQTFSISTRNLMNSNDSQKVAFIWMYNHNIVH